MGVNGEVFQLYIKSRIFYSKSRKYDKIITIVPNYTGKNTTRLLPLALLRTPDRLILSGIALYYGDTI